MLDEVEERLGRFGIELRRRLVEQQELRPQRECGCERHALQLAARELAGRAVGEVLRADKRERLVDARPDLPWLDAEVLEPERRLVRNLAHHDLVLGVLEDGSDRSRELRWTRGAGVDAADDHAAGERPAVEVRDERRERAQQRRLPGPRRTEQRDVLPVDELERELVEHRRAAGVGERERVDAR